MHLSSGGFTVAGLEDVGNYCVYVLCESCIIVWYEDQIACFHCGTVQPNLCSVPHFRGDRLAQQILFWKVVHKAGGAVGKRKNWDSTSILLWFILLIWYNNGMDIQEFQISCTYNLLTNIDSVLINLAWGKGMFGNIVKRYNKTLRVQTPWSNTRQCNLLYFGQSYLCLFTNSRVIIFLVVDTGRARVYCIYMVGPSTTVKSVNGWYSKILLFLSNP